MRGKMNKAIILGAGSLALLLAGPAMAADAPVRKAPAAAAATPPPPPFDIAFGAAVSNDYNFRGVSQSNRGWSGGGYVEPQWNGPWGQFYLGVAGWRVDMPNTPAYLFTGMTSEIDLYGGWRKTFDKLSVDLGLIYYYYPGEKFNGLTNDSDFWEIYWKGSYAVTGDLTVGANVFYTPDLLHYSKTFAAVGVNQKAPSVYASLTGKYVLPWKQGDWGSYVSGELGHWWIDDSGFLAAGPALSGAAYTDPSYTYWNAGLAFTYKIWTLDLRYHGNDMGVLECTSFLVSVVGNPSNKWCKDAYIATLKFDTSWTALK
jgi:uncharacterized protein (TIGR02001 family)